MPTTSYLVHIRRSFFSLKKKTSFFDDTYDLEIEFLLIRGLAFIFRDLATLGLQSAFLSNARLDIFEVICTQNVSTCERYLFCLQ